MSNEQLEESITAYVKSLPWGMGAASDERSAHALFQKATEEHWDSRMVARLFGVDPDALAKQWMGYLFNPWGGAQVTPTATPADPADPFVVGGS